MMLTELPLGPLERALVNSLHRLEPSAEPLVLASAALLCTALERGDVCLLLARMAGQRPWPECDFGLPALADWRARLQASPLVGAPGAFAPLILDGPRLYLARYHAYETQLATQLLARAADQPAVDEVRLTASLARLFAFNAVAAADSQAGEQADWQCLAAAQAVRRRVTVISGGPGTGKTTTVVRLLAALLEQHGGAAADSDPSGGDPSGAGQLDADLTDGESQVDNQPGGDPSDVKQHGDNLPGGDPSGANPHGAGQSAGNASGGDPSGGDPSRNDPSGGVPSAAKRANVAPLAIGLAAPTGKAAARMAEAIRRAKAALPVSAAIKAALPEEARTLHRLLGSRGDSPQVRHTAAKPLPLDVLVVDEASMVDLALMAKLVEALPPSARLILLGDKDQLCAVEAGAVFAELCEGRGFDAQAAVDLQRITGQAVAVEPPCSRLGDAVLLLTHSHRFAADSGIGELARRINAGAVAGTLKLLKEARADLTWNAQPTPHALLERLDQGYAPFLATAESADPAAAFAAFNAFRVLTAQREGAWGVAGINEALEARIKRRKQIASRERWYVGRAVMVGQNDYALGLFNGDIGICLRTEYGLRVFFESADAEGFRPFAPARLPSHDSAFAMTVHKSQGSEFSEVLLVLPEQPSPLLTRSLFYTGITRAKHKVEIWGLAARLSEAVHTRAERAAGLAQRLAVATQGAAQGDALKSVGGSHEQLSLL